MNVFKDIMTESQEYARFADGRIDYTHQRVCFVLNCVVVYGNDVLLTRRSEHVGTYPNMINGISGYIDRTDISVEEQARIELSEEVDAPLDLLATLKIGAEMVQVDESINREWHVYPVLAVFDKKFTPKINWENKTAEWYDIETAKAMELMPGFRETLERALRLKVRKD